ncbi:hypothetical protein NPA08_02810 [Mycoplasmopsis citelli]|uniref:hypothetical protein n=1 Tax=Mycoplasmopsis citelli TaxID=171281 RepID=UPI002114244D|nr:hypothetical protein [Mycoplasmopsis citelli]UUD35877.1 hypothetical protein NPA08_02810 [Mycoplasmopsis citelli]
MKLFKKILIWTVPFLSASALGGVFYYKINNSYKPSFYNYKAYMSPDNIKGIGENFEYKEFDSIQEFTRSLIDNKAIAGIGSDFQAVGLAKTHRIAKIDYSILFNDPTLKNNKKRTQTYLKLIIHPIVWEHILSYDDYLNEPNTKEEDKIHLWEYFFPYYMQDSVIAYNIVKKPIKPENQGEDESIDFEKYRSQYQEKLYDMSSLLKILTQNGFKNWNITDANRDNMVYGSTYWVSPEDNGDQKLNQHSGAVTELTYDKLIDAFVDLIQDNTGLSVSDTAHINFLGDGLNIVNNLLHPEIKTNVAIMYNGDAIDSYYGKENVDGVEDGNIRIVRPKGNLLLVDGFVISSKASESNSSEVIKNLSKNIYQEIPQIAKIINELEEKNPQFLDQITSKSINLLTEKNIANYWKTLQKVYFKNYFENSSEYIKNTLENFIDNIFNYIDLSNSNNLDKFTQFYSDEDNKDQNFKINPYPHFIKEYLLNQYKELFELLSTQIYNFYQQELRPKELLESLKSKLNNSQDDFIISILIKEFENWSNSEEFSSEVKSSQELIKDFLLDIVAWKIALVDISSDELSDEIASKWKNLQNYDFINYDSVLSGDYQFIRRNYFADYLSKIDQSALNIYDINVNDGINRVAIKPVNDKLRSLISDYYFKRTKS